MDNTQLANSLSRVGSATAERRKAMRDLAHQCEQLAKVHHLLRRNPPPRGHKAMLLVLDKERPPFWHVIDGDTCSIGRSAKAHLQLDNCWVSGDHCEIRKDGRDWLLRDHGSTNGLILNGRGVEVGFLRLGDVIQIGANRLVFCVQPEELAAKPD